MEKYFSNNKAEKRRLEIKFDSDCAKQQLLDMGFKKGMRFLDAGCATGAMLRTVKKFDRNNPNIFGIDISKEFLGDAKLRSSGMNKIKLCASNVYRLPFKNNSFDFVWSRLMLEHLVNPVGAIKEMKRVLKKGGTLAIGDLDGNCLFHYPIDLDFDRRLKKTLRMLGEYGFDPFIGRKLFHFLNVLGLKKLQVKLYPYHNIFGMPNKKDLWNWNKKIESAIDFLKHNTATDKNFLEKMKKDFVSYICNKNTFTYSVMIFAKGVK